MVTKPMRKAASRHYLVWAVVAVLVMMAVLLAYRALTGTTMSEQRDRARAEKAAQELTRMVPPNAESLSAKLEQVRLEAEQNRPPPVEKEVETPVQPEPTPNPPTQVSGLLTPRFVIPDDDLDAYEARTRGAPADRPAAKSGLWQSSDTRSRADGLQQPAALLTQMGAAVQRDSPLQAQQQLMQAYMANQLQGATGATPDGSQGFRQGLGAQAAQHQAPLTVRPASASWMVLEGASVVVVMEDDVSSDIPGNCRARVAQDVLDSVTQSMVLIPVHSRVMCTYDTGVVHGQDKMLLAFTRLIYPNGASIALGGMDAHDRYGAAGAPAEVNSRFWQIFGNSFLIAAVTRWAEPKPAQSGGVTVVVTPGDQVGGVAAGVLADTAKKVLERNINIRPELRLKAGDVLRLTVSRDMAIDPSVIQPAQAASRVSRSAVTRP